MKRRGSRAQHVLGICFAAVVAAASVGCESAAPALSTVREFHEVFVLESRVRLRPSTPDPIASPMALLRWGDRFAIVDEMQSNVKLFDRSGAGTGVIGRAGDGPGEFRQPFSAVAMQDGTLMVLDRTGLSVSRFSPTGEFLSRWRLDGYAPMGMSGTADGRLLLGMTAAGDTRGSEARLALYSADGVLQTRFGALVASQPGERGHQQVMPAVVGNTALAVADNRPAVRFRDLETGREWTASFADGVIRTADFSEFTGKFSPERYTQWAGQQPWVVAAFALDPARFAMVVREPTEDVTPRVRYVIGDVDGNTVAVTETVPVGLLAASEGRVYGLELTEDGEFDLLTFRLALP